MEENKEKPQKTPPPTKKKGPPLHLTSKIRLIMEEIKKEAKVQGQSSLKDRVDHIS